MKCTTTLLHQIRHGGSSALSCTGLAAAAAALIVSDRQQRSHILADGLAYPELKSGPWNVREAKADKSNRDAVAWAPSKSDDFLDTDSFSAGGAKGHILAGSGQVEKQGGQIKDLDNEAMRKPLVRKGVRMMPVHAAAADGDVWWLERCGAMKTCREMLKMGDARADTPLHHCARSGQASACKALLRLSMSPSAMNADDQLPEDIAAEGKHDVVADLLIRAREAGDGRRSQAA
jgi:hypothetical protein